MSWCSKQRMPGLPASSFFPTGKRATRPGLMLEMKTVGKNWLQLYVDAMTERDPYKRLALVRELMRIPRQDESDEFLDRVLEDRSVPRSARPKRKTQTPPRR